MSFMRSVIPNYIIICFICLNCGDCCRSLLILFHHQSVINLSLVLLLFLTLNT